MSIRITRSRWIHVDKNAAWLGSEGGKESNQRQYYSTGGVHSTIPRATLTQAQRGRFWQSVGNAIDAARTETAGGGQTNEIH